MTVAIIGGGLAGLYAAHLLHEAGRSFVLFEARDRLGGRILSVDHRGAPSADGFDLGPSWFWPTMQPAIAGVVRALELPAFAQYSNGDVLFERGAHEGPQRVQGMPQQARSDRLAGGTTSIVRALTEPLPADRLHTGTPVTRLDRRAGDVVLHGPAGELPAGSHGVTHVIAALPPRLLHALVSFTPPLPTETMQRWHDTPTWMAPHAKFLALYEHPFWREAGLSGTAQSLVGPMPEIHDATTASGEAALFGFVGVSAEQRARLGERALTAACLQQLVRLFGTAAATPRATLFKDWAADPFTATRADQVPGGHPIPTDEPWVEGAWSSCLALAGSETSPIEPGYLTGAIVAAERAVHRVLATS